MQIKNADNYQKIMMFKENFDISQTEKERTEDLERQQLNKKAAANFTSAAFSNLLSGFGRSSLIDQSSGNMKGIFSTTENFIKSLQQTTK